MVQDTVYDLLFDEIAAHCGVAVDERNRVQANSTLFWHADEPGAIAQQQRLDAAEAHLNTINEAIVALVFPYWLDLDGVPLR